MSEIHTLIELLNNFEVRIPIIQRDYAQGRKNEKSNEVRKNLIHDIEKSLNKNGKKIDFNFVYGTVSEKVFYPIDGQQRLTTLYLLHWFLACNINHDVNFQNMKSFNYMTRCSATEFFSILKNSNDELVSIAKSSQSFRNDIENAAWFQIEWKYDPTVDAALTFLDDLSKNYSFRENAENYYEKLKGGVITFTHIIEEGNDAENKAAKSYIRMNARGKALEPFENLKAMIDSIDTNLNSNSTDIIEKYDKKYIDLLYNKCSASSSLDSKTIEINHQSLQCLKNIYNLCVQLEHKDTISDDWAFISGIYEYSQINLNNVEEIFFEKYFKMFISVFDYFKENDDDYIKKIFESNLDFNIINNKSTVAAVLYINHYAEEKNIVLEKGLLKQYLYVLNNLNHENWNKEYLNTINDFAFEVATNKNVFEYFHVNNLSDIQNICNDVLDDIKVRIKEQKIKVEVILVNKLNYDFFNSLEEQSKCRKIQYLLYIAGYWNSYCNSYSNKLFEFIKLAEKYFKKAENELLWLKIYAIATYLDEHRNLESCQNINEKCGSFHIWNDSYYVWDDIDDEDLDINRPQLKYINKAYNNMAVIKELICSLPDDRNYNMCWLKYAIKYNHRELLDKELKWDNQNKINMIVEYRETKRFDMYVLYLEKKHIRYGLDELTINAETERRFSANSRYPFWVGDRDYIMRLNIPVKIDGINSHYNKTQCEYILDDYMKIYTIYNVISPYNFSINIYEISRAKEKQQKRKSQIEVFLNRYSESDYANIKSGSSKWNQCGRRTTWLRKIKHIRYEGIVKQDKLEL